VPTTIEAIAEIELIDTSGEMRVARRAGHPLDPAALVGREAVAIGSPLLLFRPGPAGGSGPAAGGCRGSPAASEEPGQVRTCRILGFGVT
jgi:hypothetical protein